MANVGELLREMYEGYAASVDLDPDARYRDGAPLRPVVPLDTAVGGVFILGAYPSARFAHIGTTNDVPVADNLGPFEAERWFDGTRVRQQPSARELQEEFLEPLALDRSQCWITDLVKVFLFKPGHVDRYRELRAEVPAGYLRDQFAGIAAKSLPWLERELDIARPTLMITLGAEVAGVLRGARSNADQVALLVPEVNKLQVGQTVVPTIHCAHPGILMRNGPTNPWPDKHWAKFVPAMREFLG